MCIRDRLGYKTHIFEPGANPPAADVAHSLTTASYDDIAALQAFAASVDVITYEFENIPTAALDALEALRPIRPNRRALAISQDRILEKDFLTGLGLTCAPVTYTHLDVYKRQPYPRPIRMVCTTASGTERRRSMCNNPSSRSAPATSTCLLYTSRCV